MKTALIFGALGQDGHYLSEHLLHKGYSLVGTTHRPVTSVVRWAGPLHALDMTDGEGIAYLISEIKPDEIYNLAARASSAQLFDDSVASGDVNGLAVTRILDAITRHSPSSRFCQALSSEVFALAQESPQDESTPLAPANAYGAAKAYAWHMVQAYRAEKDLFACGAILYNHESPLRAPQFVTRKITQAAARIACGSLETLNLGDPEHRRDWGHARDHTRALYLMLQGDKAEDYIVATGTTHSVRQFCAMAFAHVGLDYRDHVRFESDSYRRKECHELCGDPRKAEAGLGWQAQISLKALVQEMVDADLGQLDEKRSRRRVR